MLICVSVVCSVLYVCVNLRVSVYVCLWVCTGVDELQGHVEELRKAVQERSEEIVRLLLSRDRRQRRQELNFEKMSTALKQTAKDFGELECRLVLYSSGHCMYTQGRRRGQQFISLQE